MNKLTGIVRDILCTGLALFGGAAYATVYTDAWTEGATPASSHNGYITYAYHSAGGIQTMTVNPPEDGDEFIFTGGKLSIMNSSSTGSGNASISATKACKVVFQNDVYARNFTMTAPAAPTIVTNHFYRNLIGTDYVTVLANANLDDYEPISIFQDYKDETGREIDSTSGQRWLNRAQTLFPHILVREAGKLSFQYQTGAADVKADESKDGYKVSRVIKVEMKQVGADIKMRAVNAYSVYSDASNPLNHGFDVDVLWDTAEVEEQLLYTGGDDAGYGLNTVALKYIGPTFTMRFEGSSNTINKPQPSASAKVEIAGGTTLNQMGFPDVRGGSIAILDRSHTEFKWYVNSYAATQGGEILFATTQPTSSPSVTNTLVYKTSADWIGKTPIAVKGIDGYPMLLDVQQPRFGLPSNSTVTVKYGGIVKLGGSNLTFSNGDKGGVKSGTCDCIVEKGGLLHQAVNWTFGKNTEITLNGGTLLISSGDDASLSTDFRNLTLRNGALIDVVASRADKPMRIGQLGTGFTWNVSGDAPSTNNVLVQFCSYGANKVSTNTFNVAKTGDGSFDADLVFTKPIQMHGGTVTYTTNVLRKIGFGTMRLNGAYTVPGTVLIEGGAIKLGASDSWGDSSKKTPIVLCGGALAAAANTSNGLGRVTLTADSELKLEEGACLTCDDLSAVAWADGAMLDVTIPATSEKVLLGSVRFGETKGGLTEDQLQAIRINGKKAMLDSAGWLQYRQLGTRVEIR